MTSERAEKIKIIFDQAFELESAARTLVLAEACGDDYDLRTEVEKLLHLHDDANDFLEAPPLINELSSSTAMNSDAVIDRRIGAYKVIRELGRGGMGAVFLAHRADQTFEKQVAIKLVWPGLGSDEIIQRFQQERQILAKLEHPNIARLLDGGVTEEGWHYIVMEYIDGVSITQFCGNKLLSIPARLQLFRAVCEAVQFAHQNLVIHRDLKPGNILVTADGSPKLLDFGIAKLLEANESSLALTHTQLPLTPEYASPEQLNNQPVTTATDVYSLGVVFYEILTRRKPYHFKSPLLHVIARVVTEVEPDKPNLDEDLENIVLKAMRKEPRNRYSSVEQFNTDIGRYLDGDIVFARKATASYRISKFVRRHKLPVALAALLILTLVVVALAAMSRNITAREQAREQRRQLYATQMNRAMQDWELGNLSRMRETLDNWLPQSGQEDLRGFEWHYLWRLRNPNTINFKHEVTADFGGLNFSEHDNFVWGSEQKVFSLWDAKTGQKLVTRDFTGHQKVTLAHLEKDFPVMLEDEKKLQMFSLRTGQTLYSMDVPAYTAMTDELRTGTIYTGHADGTLKLWDVPRGKLRTSLQWQDTPIGAIYFTFNWQKVFTRVSPHEWQLRGLRNGTPQIIKTETTTTLPNGSPDGNYFFLNESGAGVRVFDSATGRELGRITAPGEPILHSSFAPDSRHLIITTTDSTAKLYDLPALKLTATFRSKNDWMPYAEVSPDGKLLLAICGAQTVKLWDTATQKEVAVVKGHEAKVIGAHFSRDGSKLLTWGMDGLARIWSVADLLKSEQLTGHAEGVFAVAFSPDGKTLASVSKDRTIKLWDVQTSQLIRTITGHTAWVFAVVFSPDGKTLATGGQDNTLRLWNVATGQEVRRLSGHLESVRSIAFSPDGLRLATASSDATVRVWDVASGRTLTQLQGHKGEVFSVAFSLDGNQILSAGADNTARLWDVNSGQEIRQLQGHTADVWAAKFSPDGSTIATASADYSIKLWEAKTGRETATMRGHANDIFSLAWSPDGTRIATTSNDATVRLWNVKLAMEVLMMRQHAEQVWSVAFSPDGKTLASGSWDTTVRFSRTTPDSLSP